MSWPWQRSIQARIVLLFLGLTASVLMAVNVIMAKTIVRGEIEEAGNHLQIQALMAASALQDPLSGYYETWNSNGVGRGLAVANWINNLEDDLDANIFVYDLHGDILAGEGEPLSEHDIKRLEKGRSWHELGLLTIEATAPIQKDQKLAGAIRLSTSQHKVSSRTRKLVKKLSIISVSSLFIAWILAIFLSRRLVKPLKLLEQSAIRASKGRWDLPAELSGQDELAVLSRAFASMLKELRSMLEQQKNFVSHASHELRTPLTRMKLRTEALAQGAINDPEVAERFAVELDREVDRLTSLTNRLLELGRLEGRVGSPTIRDPEKEIKANIERFRLDAMARKITLQLSIEGSLGPIALSEEDLDSILENLVGNALKYTPEQGKIVVRAQPTAYGISLSVSDSGCGIAAKHLPYIFNRFYRADESRSTEGVGLGLSLVKAIIDNASGKISVSSDPAKGTTFTLEIPSTNHL